MPRPINRSVSRTTKIGLSSNQMKGAMATAVLGTLAATVTTSFVEKIRARQQARATAKAFKEQADAALEEKSK